MFAAAMQLKSSQNEHKTSARNTTSAAPLRVGVTAVNVQCAIVDDTPAAFLLPHCVQKNRPSFSSRCAGPQSMNEAIAVI